MIKDIRVALDNIEAITKTLKNNLNEIIGVWGELYIIHFLLNSFKDKKKIQKEIINGWENYRGRALIDIELNIFKTKIEVKTTTAQERIHHISSIGQVAVDNEWDGYIASICINEGKGKSCNDIRVDILKLLDNNLKDLFVQRLEIRGAKLCYDEKYYFEVNDNNKVRYFNFNNVPKPILNNGIINIKWDIILEGIDSIDETKMVDKFNFSY